MKYIAKIAAFTAIFLIINLILCGFMPPDNGSSLGMWRSYQQKQSIDIAVIGSSLASCALPEEELAAATGETVALMATNAQSLDMSQIALETLLREHSPRYVILVMDLANMTGKPYAKAQKAFLYAELQTDSWKDKPADLLRYMTSRDNFTGADSLNALFPWQSGSWPTDWPATIQQKWNAVLNRLPHRRGAAHAQPEDTTVINFDTVGTVNTWSQSAHDFSAQHIEELTSMLQLCQENGTRLLLISAPKTTLDVVSYETYFDDYAYFKQLAAQYGASYYDFNLAKPELFENKEPDYHKDFTHMNAAGGHAFSLSMAKFLAMLDGMDLVGLSWFDAGVRSFYTREKVTGLDDLQGLTIRVQESDMMSDMITALGAKPAQVVYSKVYAALHNAEIDGAENNWPSYEVMGHYEVAPFFLKDEHTRVPEVQLASPMVMEKLAALGESYPEIIRACARESAQTERELWARREANAEQNMRKRGICVTELDEAEKARFRAAVQPMYDRFHSHADLIQRIRES